MSENKIIAKKICRVCSRFLTKKNWYSHTQRLCGNCEKYVKSCVVNNDMLWEDLDSFDKVYYDVDWFDPEFKKKVRSMKMTCKKDQEENMILKKDFKKNVFD